MHGAMAALALAALLPSDASAQAYQLAPVARDGDPAPGTGGQLASVGISGAVFGGPGEVAFVASWDGPSPGSGIFLASGGVVSAPLVSSLDVAPGTGGASFAQFSGLDRNAAGTLAFTASYGGGSLSERGVFRLEGGGLTAVALVGGAAPGTGGGSYAGFEPLTNRSLDASGEIAFRATLAGGSAAQGIFRSSGSSVVPVALLGDAAPTGGIWTAFDGAPRIDDQGRVTFVGSTPPAPGAEQVARVPIGGPAETLVAMDPGCSPLFALCLANLADPTPGGDGELVFWAEVVFDLSFHVFEGIFRPAPPVPVGFVDALGPLPAPPTETWVASPPGGLNGDGAVAYTATALDENLEVIAHASVVKTRRWHVPVARTGDPAPGGGTIGFLDTADLSDEGVVLFLNLDIELVEAGLFTATPPVPVPALSPIALAALALLLLAGAGLALRRAAARAWMK
jgi:hypothetical protein